MSTCVPASLYAFPCIQTSSSSQISILTTRHCKFSRSLDRSGVDVADEEGVAEVAGTATVADNPVTKVVDHMTRSKILLARTDTTPAMSMNKSRRVTASG